MTYLADPDDPTRREPAEGRPVFGVPRRTLLHILGLFGMGAGALTLLPGCGDEDAEADTSDLTHEMRTRALTALMGVLIPSTSTSTGAVEAKAVDFLRSDALMKTTVQLGYITDLSKTPLKDLSAVVNTALEVAIYLALEVSSKQFDLLKGFADLTADQQKKVVTDLWSSPVHRPLMDLARIAALFSYVAAVYNDKGIVNMGFPPYENFKAFWHNHGLPNTSLNKVPEYEGKQAWDIELE